MDQLILTGFTTFQAIDPGVASMGREFRRGATEYREFGVAPPCDDFLGCEPSVTCRSGLPIGRDQVVKGCFL